MITENIKILKIELEYKDKEIKILNKYIKKLEKILTDLKN